MPKPISQRGFEVSKGNIDRVYISYAIDETGLECISVYKNLSHKKLQSRVSMTLDEGNIKYLLYDTPQFKDSDSMEGEEWKIKSKQAMEIYHEVKRILNVDKKLKNYHPRFSHESEFSPFNVLGLEDASQLESWVEEGK